MTLYQSLQQYIMRGMTPLHMPGHKRNPAFRMENPYAIDITEVEGMDDLHHPTGVIRELMERFRQFYETRSTYLLVNGSTSGNMIAIASSCRRGDVIVTDANCHRSVPHAVELLGLKSVRIVRPDMDGDARIPGPIRPEDVEDLFKHLASAGRTPAAIVITSPTYEGVVSDIKAIADIVHHYGTILIVDEAHGAHLTLAARTAGLTLDWPKPATMLGADFVIESLHKTLPALTQTAVLHRMSDRVSDETVMNWHDTFITSSPSYVLMASIDQCLSWQERQGIAAFRQYDKGLKKIYEAAAKTRQRSDGSHRSGMDLLPPDGRDPSKLILLGDGPTLAGQLLGQRIEPERVEENYVIMMTGPGDMPETLKRLASLSMI
ncbi:MAG: aminotransferase class I/II-fold pyridoxal phosphate-dependent enzyme [Eubacterium sp.]|nr:aminotransferase class I/II-fold pyridoxal phosphate-dependent enzyme [Eubacterium sp.]